MLTIDRKRLKLQQKGGPSYYAFQHQNLELWFYIPLLCNQQPSSCSRYFYQIRIHRLKNITSFDRLHILLLTKLNSLLNNIKSGHDAYFSLPLVSLSQHPERDNFCFAGSLACLPIAVPVPHGFFIHRKMSCQLFSIRSLHFFHGFKCSIHSLFSLSRAIIFTMLKFLPGWHILIDDIHRICLELIANNLDISSSCFIRISASLRWFTFGHPCFGNNKTGASTIACGSVSIWVDACFFVGHFKTSQTLRYFPCSIFKLPNN